MEQLTIFEVMNEFDSKLAKWENVLNCFERCKVLAYIPEDALSPLEQKGWRTNPDTYNLWRDYAGAIYSYLGPGDVWGQACDMLKEFRNAKKPCLMEIRRSIKFPEQDYFKPDHVVEYLDYNV